jgi:hypothetical protein
VRKAWKNAAVFLAVVRRNTTLSTVTFRSHKAISGSACNKTLKDTSHARHPVVETEP